MFNDFGWKTRKYAGRHRWRMCLLTFGRLMGLRRGMRYRLKNNNWAARWHASSTRRLTTYKQTDLKVNISRKLPRRSIFPLYFHQRVLSASPDTVINQPPSLRPNRHPSSLNNLSDGPRRRKSRSRCGQHVVPHFWTRRKTNCSWLDDGLFVWIYWKETLLNYWYTKSGVHQLFTL